jgi:hypothetical protein
MLRALHVFPWDAAAEGSGAAMDAVRALKVNTVLLSVNYHRARLFRPRQPALGYYSRPHDWLDFDPDPSLYPAGFPLPPGNPDRAVVQAVSECREHCRRSDLRFHASVIGCHNTTLGLSRPDLTVRTAFDDRYAFALCPANPDVRAYLIALVRDVCRKLTPDALLLDSFSFLNAVHREHHELMFVPTGPAAEHLLGLCFCEHCRAWATRRGVDSEAVRLVARRMVETTLVNEGHSGQAGFDDAELGALLMEEPILAAFEEVRRAIVRSLLEEIKAAAQETSCAIDINSGLLARPSARAWTEGASLRDRAAVARHIYVQAHFPRFEQSRQDLAWAATVLPPQRLLLATMMSLENVGSAQELRARVEMAAAMGVAGVSVYNYGLLTERRLEWIRDTFAAMERKAC